MKSLNAEEVEIGIQMVSTPNFGIYDVSMSNKIKRFESAPLISLPGTQIDVELVKNDRDGVALILGARQRTLEPKASHLP